MVDIAAADHDFQIDSVRPIFLGFDFGDIVQKRSQRALVVGQENLAFLTLKEGFFQKPHQFVNLLVLEG